MLVSSFQSLLSTTGFGLGAKYFAFYEIEGVGVQWNNIAISPVEDDQYNLLLVVLMMFLDALIYSILTWYIENVHPGCCFNRLTFECIAFHFSSVIFHCCIVLLLYLLTASHRQGINHIKSLCCCSLIILIITAITSLFLHTLNIA